HIHHRPPPPPPTPPPEELLPLEENPDPPLDPVLAGAADFTLRDVDRVRLRISERIPRFVPRRILPSEMVDPRCHAGVIVHSPRAMRSSKRFFHRSSTPKAIADRKSTRLNSSHVSIS